jgi:hypothetical protein
VGKIKEKEVMLKRILKTISRCLVTGFEKTKYHPHCFMCNEKTCRGCEYLNKEREEKSDID